MTMSDNIKETGPKDARSPAQPSSDATRSTLGTSLPHIENGQTKGGGSLYAGIAGLAIIAPVLVLLYAISRVPQLQQDTVL